MKEKRLPRRGKNTIGMRIDMVQDLVAVCPKCGGEIGLWSEDKETVCIFCDHKLFEREGTVH